MAKNFFFTLLFIFNVHLVQAQRSNFVIFSEKNDPFTLVINGQQINSSPTVNLKVSDLESGQYALRVVFNNPGIPGYEEVIFINSGNEVTYALQRDQYGNTKMRFINEFSLVYRPIPPGNQQNIAYSGPIGLPPTNNVTPPAVISNPVPQPGTLDVSVVTPPRDPVVVDPPQIVAPTTTTVVTPPVIVAETTVVVIEEMAPPPPLPGYTGPIGCESPMDDIAFEAVKGNINSKSFSDSKMRIAKQVARSNCLFTKQIRDIMNLFSFETDKLEFAKFAYDFTYDQGNYYKVNDAFSFENTISELDKFLKTK